jgi:hypothetical protein
VKVRLKRQTLFQHRRTPEQSIIEVLFKQAAHPYETKSTKEIKSLALAGFLLAVCKYNKLFSEETSCINEQPLKKRLSSLPINSAKELNR